MHGWIQMWDADTGQPFSEYMEHQKRAWSIHFSQFDPKMFASGSDDCSVKLWNINEVWFLFVLFNFMFIMLKPDIPAKKMNKIKGEKGKRKCKLVICLVP